MMDNSLFSFLVLVGGGITIFILFSRLGALKEKLEALEWKFRALESRLETMLPTQKEEKTAEPNREAAHESKAPSPVIPPPIPAAPPLKSTPIPIPRPVIPEPIFSMKLDESERPESSMQSEAPPKIPPFSAPPVVPAKVVNWEKFLGVNLFAWIGGLALFLGVCFFIKYSFEHNLISPQMRIALGYLMGLGLLAGGVVMRNKNYEVTAQTLCATGVVVLYGVSFGGHGVYHLFNSFTAFAIMSVVTAAAFILAVRLEAKVVAILGLVGGFLTPPLLSTGIANPVGLFGYITLLQLGLLAIAFRKEWNSLILMGAIGTALMEIGWTLRFFSPEKVLTAFNILLLFNALAVGAYFVFEKFGKRNQHSALAIFIQSMVSFGGVAFFLLHPALSERPGIVLSTILIGDLAILCLPLARNDLFRAHTIAGTFTFLLLAAWIRTHFAEPLLYWALGATLLFAILHSVYPHMLQRWRKIKAPAIWANVFPLVALATLLLAMFRMEHASFLLWPVILLLDLLILGLAFLSASIVIAAGGLVLTTVLSAAWIFRVPADFSEASLIAIILLFAVVFIAGTLWLLEKGAAAMAGELGDENQELIKLIPASAAILPFMLLCLILMRFKVQNPSQIFTLALVLDLVLLWLGRRMRAEGFDVAALGASLFLALFWHQGQCTALNAALAITWYVAFFLLFFIQPFVFSRDLQEQPWPWAVSALSGPLYFYLIYGASKKLLINFPAMGLIPAAMLIPALAGLFATMKKPDLSGEQRNRVLAWMGGSALFFLTLIFPIQFEKQWITIGWALEGAALIWLYTRVPQRWLPAVGIGLLVLSFARLGLNIGVFEYYPRSSVRIFNWYLYSYGLVTVCLLAAARWLAPPRNFVFGRNAPPLLYTLGTILAFILLNIEIADFFAEGPRLTFEFSSRFDRDMTYSIAWALFALGLLVIGIRKELKAVRYGALGLLSVTLLKLFLHDLSQLGQLYRVGAFMGVAVILIFASWIYQRYLASTAQNNSPQPDQAP